MKKFFCAALFCTSFFSYTAETPNKSSLTTRGRDLGNTGAETKPVDFVRRRVSSSPRFSPDFLREEALVLHQGALKPNPGIKSLDSTDKKS